MAHPDGVLFGGSVHSQDGALSEGELALDVGERGRAM